MSTEEAARRAAELWQEAYRLQMAGELDRAIETYRRSIEVHPTAEAHTYLGWTYSFQGKLDESTSECMRAIEIDPEFGNPYNDIGVYLMQRDRLEDDPWLEQAKLAKRYEPRQFPYMNLGRSICAGDGGGTRCGSSGRGARGPERPRERKALHTLRGRLN
jgi:tetratricopeptide (TPR) repeat protein